MACIKLIEAIFHMEPIASLVLSFTTSMLFSAWNWSKTCHICINWAWVIIWTEITSPIIWSEDVLTISKPTPPPRKYIGLRIYCNSDLIYISFKIQRQQLDIKSVYFWCGWARGFVLFPIEELQQYCMLLLAKLFKKIPRKIFLRYFDKTTFGDVHWNRFKKKLRQTLYLTGKSFRKFDNFEIYSDIELVCSRRRHVDKV